MRSLAAFIMAGRIQASTAICLLSLLSWIIPFFSLVAAAAVALPTLRKGAAEGGIAVVGALIPLMLVGGWWIGSFQHASVYGFLLWTPAWLSAVVLRESGRLALALGTIALLGMLAVVGAYVFLTEPSAFWLESLKELMIPVMSSGSEDFDAERLARSFEQFAHYLTGLVAAASALSWILSLLIARWWQAKLFNPRGFRDEFYKLRIPVSTAYLSIGLLAVAWLADGKISEIAWNLAFPCFVPFLLAGFAVLHALLSGREGRKFWLYGIYAVLMFIPHAILPITLLGLSDAWVDWRRFGPSV